MGEFLVRVRRSNGRIQQIFIKSDSKLQELKQIISSTFGMQLESFQLYYIEQLLDCSADSKTLQQMGIDRNSILDVRQAANSQNSFQVTLQYGINRVSLDTFKQQNLRSLKQRISDIFDCSLHQFDLLLHDKILQNDQATVSQIGIQMNDLILVKRKIPITQSLMNGLNSKFKEVQSIASGSDNIDQNQSKQSNSLYKKFGFNVHKKSSCSASMRSIQIMGQDKKNMKHSSIQPYSLHKTLIDQIDQKQNKLVKIEDIKQTMSFGSLQQVRSQETQLELFNQNKTLFYKFKCPLGCRILNVKKTLARAERKTPDKLEIPNTNDNDLVDQIVQDTNNDLCLLFKILQ